MLVSVVIPCYNVQNYIVECVESVISQTYKNIELICVDNNSKDNTWEQLLNLKQQFPNLIIDKELKPGACAARNKGLLLAKGEWIQFLDADDLLLNNKIEHQVKLISESKDIHVIAGACIRRNTKHIDELFVQLSPNKFLAPFINQSGNTCSNLWKRSAVMDVGMWNENIKSSQETELMLRLTLKGYCFLIDTESLTIIRERNEGQISQRNPIKKWEQYIEVRLDYIKALKENHIEEYEQLKGRLYDFLMISIITLSIYNKSKAISYFKYIKPNWKSSQSFGMTR